MGAAWRQRLLQLWCSYEHGHTSTHQAPTHLPPGRYENIVQIRCLYEGVTVEDMLTHWDTLLPEYMAKWGLKRPDVSDHNQSVSGGAPTP